MRLGVLDVGSNTVHLLVVDAHPGARPWPAASHKVELRLAEHLTGDGLIDDPGADRLVEFVGEALQVAEDSGCEDILPVRHLGHPRGPQRRGGPHPRPRVGRRRPAGAQRR
jgi:exopolyphosphatase/pppGpp-phosphohydrolase